MKNAERLNKLLAGKYTIESLIGSGGMGVVYAATHRLTRERVAVKFLRDEEMDDPELKRRFVKEAQAAANLRHPNVVRLIDLDEDSEYGMYMVLELLSGETLSDLLTRSSRLPLAELCEVLFPIMHALGAAHERGILHRDIKPANIFLHREPDGRVVPKLLDFGIVRMLPMVSKMLTRTGEVLGTPDYMSPEQAYGEKLLGPPTDVWAMGVVIYRALCGVAPFERDNLEATMLDVAAAKYAPIDQRCPELPRAAALQAVIGRALTLEVRRRTPSMSLLMRELAEVANLDTAAILARFGPVVAAPAASTAPPAAQPRVADTAPTARLRRAHKPAFSLWLVGALLLAALCAAWGAFTALWSRRAAPATDSHAEGSRPSARAFRFPADCAREPLSGAPPLVATPEMPSVISVATVAALENNRGSRCVLWADHLVGRSPEAALKLENPSVSWRHASLRWTGQVWELQDLGSLNGTFLDGSRIPAGARVPLRVGARVRFGGGDVEWLMAEGDPPGAVAVALDDGTRITPCDGLLALPDSDHPELSIHRRVDGTWLAESMEKVWTPECDEVVVAGGRRFRFEPGGVVFATAAGAERLPTPATIGLEFAVTRNEEQVEITIVHGESRQAVRPRAHTYLLLTLARLRLHDQAEGELPITSHGWVDQQRLLKMLATSPPQLALDVYRARRQFGDAGVVDSAQLVERRTVSRELRIGVSALSVRVV